MKNEENFKFKLIVLLHVAGEIYADYWTRPKIQPGAEFFYVFITLQIIPTPSKKKGEKKSDPRRENEEEKLNFLANISFVVKKYFSGGEMGPMLMREGTALNICSCRWMRRNNIYILAGNDLANSSTLG